MKQNIFPFIWSFLHPKRLSVFLIFFCSCIWALTTSFNPYLLKWIIDGVVNQSHDPKNVWDKVGIVVAIFILLQIFLIILKRVEEWVRLNVIQYTKGKIRMRMFDHVQQHSHRYFQENFSGSLSRKVSDMVSGFESMFSSITLVFFPIILSCSVSIVLLWMVHYWFALSVLLWLVPYLIIARRSSLKCMEASNEHSKTSTELSGKVVDTLRNISTVELFSQRDHENNYLDHYQKEEIHRAQKLGIRMIANSFIHGISGTFLFSSSLILFISLWGGGLVTIGDFTFIIATTFSIMILTLWMVSEISRFFKALGVVNQAMTIFNMPHEIVDVPNAKPLKVNSTRIEFKNVTFRYEENKNILQDKSIVIEPGEKVGLVGFSGSGKTTFVHLILRFYDVQAGKILIDNQDISQVTLKSLRRQIAVVPQDMVLFHRSLMENIRYGRADASDDEVFAASKKACSHEFIMEFKDKYNTITGESGFKLSGGQRQRIAIARAILKDAPILIFDEATSALDSITEKEIQKNLWDLMKNRTTIVIAHRLSTLSSLDRILVFDKGVIIESGKHESLLKRNGHYAHLWRSQSEGFFPKNERSATPESAFNKA